MPQSNAEQPQYGTTGKPQLAEWGLPRKCYWSQLDGDDQTDPEPIFQIAGPAGGEGLRWMTKLPCHPFQLKAAGAHNCTSGRGVRRVKRANKLPCAATRWPDAILGALYAGGDSIAQTTCGLFSERATHLRPIRPAST